MSPAPARLPTLGFGLLAAGFVCCAVGLGACGGAAEAVEDIPFGSRADDRDGRETLLITPPDSAQEFFYYPAYFNEVEVRAGAFEAGHRPVELLIRGALPDGCTALHNIEQERVGHIIAVTFEMRRPKGAVCTQVVRPYRFYYPFPEPLPPGDYTLKLNDEVWPFTVQPPREGEAGG